VALIDSFFESIGHLNGGSEDDRWCWRPEGGSFSVNSTYLFLECLHSADYGLTDSQEGVFHNIWKSPAPSKVVAFSWKLLLNRIPSRANLALRNVLGPDSSTTCVLCGCQVETSLHLFLHCSVAARVWDMVARWLDFSFITPPTLFIHFLCWSDEAFSLKVRGGFWLIWHAIIWVLWNVRNDRIFSNRAKDVDEIVEEVKVLSWKWSLSRLRNDSCLYYEWCWNPKDCIRRG
jgi:hypothetical protein